MQSLLDQVVEADAREVLRAAAAAHVSGLSGRPPVMPVGAMSPVTSTMEAGGGSVPLRQQSPGSGELVAATTSAPSYLSITSAPGWRVWSHVAAVTTP